MKRLTLTLLALGAVMLFPGCGCLSSQQISAKVAALRLQNRTRAEPAMLAAATARGASLLPLEPQDVSHHLPCLNDSDDSASSSGEPPHDICLWMERSLPGCQEWADDGHSFFIRHAGGKPQLVIPIRPLEGSTYARIARRGNKLFVLLPQLTTRKEVGTLTECECDGMPRTQCPSSYGFVLDDAPPSVEIEEVRVPMSEEYLKRKCKVIAV